MQSRNQEKAINLIPVHVKIYKIWFQNSLNWMKNTWVSRRTRKVQNKNTKFWKSKWKL